MFDIEIAGTSEKKTKTCINAWVNTVYGFKLVCYLVDNPAIIEDGLYQLTIDGVRFTRE
jgi:hypothetical protein